MWFFFFFLTKQYYFAFLGSNSARCHLYSRLTLVYGIPTLTVLSVCLCLSVVNLARMETRRRSAAAVFLLLSLSVLYCSNSCLASAAAKATATEAHDGGRKPAPAPAPAAEKSCGFPCRGGKQCVNEEARCDGHKDCPEGDDEEKCPADPPQPQPCSSQQFKCEFVLYL